MPFIEVQPFGAGLLEDAEQMVENIEQLERIRRDARTTTLLVSARQFLATLETYFEHESGR